MGPTPPPYEKELPPPPNLAALRATATPTAPRRRVLPTIAASPRPPPGLLASRSASASAQLPKHARTHIAPGGWEGVVRLAAYGLAAPAGTSAPPAQSTSAAVRPDSGASWYSEDSRRDSGAGRASRTFEYAAHLSHNHTASAPAFAPSNRHPSSLLAPGGRGSAEPSQVEGRCPDENPWEPLRVNRRASNELRGASVAVANGGVEARAREREPDDEADFSFLYDEEPPSARRKRESAGSGSLKKKAGSRNSLGSLRKDIFPTSPRRNPTSPASPLTPAGDRSSRRVSVLVLPPSSSAGPLLSASQTSRLTGDHRRQTSLESVESSDSNPNYATGSAYRRSREFGFYNEPSNASSESMGPKAPAAPLDPEIEKLNRLRLAEFLNETASAMEGGKSLAMVHPESFQPSVDDSRTSTEIINASVTSSGGALRPSRLPTRPRSSISLRSVDGGLPGAFGTAGLIPRPAGPRGSPAPTITAAKAPDSPGHRRTRYFTPVLASEPQFSSGDDGEASGELSADSDGTPDAGDELELVRENAPRDLGLGLEINSAGGRSPSTLRAASPSFSGPPRSVRTLAETESLAESAKAEEDEAEVARLRAKMVDRRGRIICELIETEAAFASDMAVVRDIFLARARGCDMAVVADHVMSSGLGLGNIVGECPPSPPPSATSAHFPHISTPPALKNSQRRPTLIRRPSGALEMPRADMEQSIISSKDIHIIFANLEEIAGFAEAFSGLLDGAWTSGSEDDMADRIGEAFITMIPRIQKIFSSYCAHHHRAILRLQELEPTLRPYLAECKTLSHGRTNAWDLASLLIKPVQRCLKYPLLIDQILAATPADHPDRPNLERADREMLNVAEEINNFKKRSDLVGKIVQKKDPLARRDTATSVTGSFGRSVTKKLMRGSQRAKQAVGLVDQQERDEMFDTFSALVDSTRSGVLRFSSEMREWSRTTKAALDSQAVMVEGWIELYSPMEVELKVEGGGHDRLCVFLESVLRPIIAGPWRDLDLEIRRNLDLKTEHLLSLFENPRAVISKRNDKLLDHSRYLAKRLPQDKRGSEDFLTLTAQLLEELPRFLGQVSRYFNIIISAFATAQAKYHHAVQKSWSAFADDWFTLIPDGSYSLIEDTFTEKHRPVSQIMDSLAAGLGLSAQIESRLSSRRPSLVPIPSTGDPAASFSSTQRHSRHGAPASARSSGFAEYSISSLRSSSSVSRTSQHSDSSTPSFVMSSTASSSLGSAETPSPLNWSTGRPVFPAKFGDALAQTPEGKRTSYLSDSSSDIPGGGTMLPGPRIGRTIDDAQRVVTSLSMYLPNEADLDSDVDEPVLYIAEAAAASKSSAIREGYPIMSFELGEALHVVHEEADTDQGGSGWLMGRKDDGSLGWARSEDFMLREG